MRNRLYYSPIHFGDIIMYQALTGPAGDGSIAVDSDTIMATFVREVLPPLSPILLGIVAAKNHEKESLRADPNLHECIWQAEEIQ
jgi:hypothetical protein